MIYAWQRLSDRITTSGKLVDEDLPRLLQARVEHVINLAPEDSVGALEAEAEKLAAVGIAYTFIPIPFTKPEERHYRQFVAAIEAGVERIHVHCMANSRVSAFFYR